MEITFKKLGINGEGIGYDHRIPVFCDGVLPGEKAEVEIILDHGSYRKAQCVKLLQRSSERTESVCRNQKRCRSCPMMILSYDSQLKYKKELLEEALYKYGNVKRDLVRNIRGSELQTGYRNQLKLPVREKDGKLITGMYLPDSNAFINIRHCEIHDPLLEKTKHDVLDVLNTHHMRAYDGRRKQGIRYLVMRILGGRIQCTLITGRDRLSESLIRDLINVEPVISVYQSRNTIKQSSGIFGSEPILLAGEEYLTTEAGKLRLFLSPESFYQLNEPQAQKLYETAVSKIDPCDVIVEAYCGIGAMSLMAHDKAETVIGIENIPSAVRNAEMNARENGIRNARFLCMDAADGLLKTARTQQVDTLIADPPRSGMDDRMLEAIMKTDIKKIIYISCNPATLAKNLKVLKQKYLLRTVIPFDMFPQTPHIESIAVLSLPGSKQ